MKDKYSREEHMAIFIVVAFSIFLFLIVVAEHTHKEQATAADAVNTDYGSQAPSNNLQCFLDSLTSTSCPQVPVTPSSTPIGNGVYVYQGKVGAM
jgi:hypothetical protein